MQAKNQLLKVLDNKSQLKNKNEIKDNIDKQKKLLRLKKKNQR